jgi:hypothetical protein
VREDIVAYVGCLFTDSVRDAEGAFPGLGVSLTISLE